MGGNALGFHLAVKVNLSRSRNERRRTSLVALLVRLNTAPWNSSLFKTAAVSNLNRCQIGLIDLRTFQQPAPISLHATFDQPTTLPSRRYTESGKQVLAV